MKTIKVRGGNIPVGRVEISQKDNGDFEVMVRGNMYKVNSKFEITRYIPFCEEGFQRPSHSIVDNHGILPILKFHSEDFNNVKDGASVVLALGEHLVNLVEN